MKPINQDQQFDEDKIQTKQVVSIEEYKLYNQIKEIAYVVGLELGATIATEQHSHQESGVIAYTIKTLSSSRATIQGVG